MRPLNVSLANNYSCLKKRIREHIRIGTKRKVEYFFLLFCNQFGHQSSISNHTDRKALHLERNSRLDLSLKATTHLVSICIDFKNKPTYFR